MLSDRIMVRVGGGWKSLDHFLLVHDPCRIEEMRLCKYSNSISTQVTSMLHTMSCITHACIATLITCELLSKLCTLTYMHVQPIVNTAKT